MTAKGKLEEGGKEPRSLYRTLPSGEVVRRGPDGVYYSETPGTPSGRLKSMGAQLVGDAPKMALEGAGYSIGGPGGAFVGGAVGEAGERLAAGKLLGEKQNGFIDYVVRPTMSGAVAGLTGGIGKVEGKGAVGAINKAARGVERTGYTGRIVRNRELIDAAEIGQTAADFERFGMTAADTGRVTQSSSISGVQRYIGSKAGEAGDIFRAREKALREQITDALAKGKGGLPPIDLNPGKAGKELVSAARGVKEGLIKRRRARADVLFKQAFDEAGDAPIEVSGTIGQLNQLVKDAPTEEYRKTLATFQKALKAKKGTNGILQPPPLRVLDKVQKTLGNKARGLMERGESQNIELAQELFSVRDSLITDMSKVSKSYKLAQATWKQDSTAIDRFEGKFGKSLLEGLTKTEKDYVHNAPTALFGKSSSPAIIKSVKPKILALKDGTRKWKAITRGAMSDVIGGLDETLKIPQWKMDILKESLTPKQFEALTVFRGALEKVGYIPWSQRGALASEGERILGQEVGGLAYKLRRATLSPYIQSKEMTAKRIDKNAVAIAKELSTGAGIKKILRLKQLSNKPAEMIGLLNTIIGPEAVRLKTRTQTEGKLEQ
jgi:hypothetical protein